MNIQGPSTARAAKFAIGQPVLRTEDPKLLRGEGRYTDDINLPGQAYAAIVRSRHAHGVIRSIGTDAARKMPGVLAVSALHQYAGLPHHQHVGKHLWILAVFAAAIVALGIWALRRRRTASAQARPVRPGAGPT